MTICRTVSKVARAGSNENAPALDIPSRVTARRPEQWLPSLSEPGHLF